MKRWMKVHHAATGGTVVTVTLQEGDLSAKHATKTTMSGIKQGAREAHGYALKALADLTEVERALSDE